MASSFLSRAKAWVRDAPLLATVALLVCAPCVCLFAIQIRSLAGPLQGLHEWRQGETYSVAYAFIHESASFFYPRHAWRGELTGIVGMEAPVYQYALSLLMRVFGDGVWVGRVLNWTLFVYAFGLWGARVWRLEGAPYALGLLVMVAFSPAAMCEFRQVQPDPMMASCAVLAAVHLSDHGRDGARDSYLKGLAFYTVSLLTKPIAIALLPAMVLFTWCGPKRPRWREALLRAAGFALPLALMWSWDRWAHHLVETYMNGNMLISIDHSPAQMWREMQNADARRLILIGLVQIYGTCLSLWPAVLVGIPYAFRRPTRAWALPFLAWAAGMVVISLAFSSRYYANWYYMLLFVPPLVFFGALGLGALFEVLCLHARDPLRLTVALALLLASCLIAPMLEPLDWNNISNVTEQLAIHLRHGIIRGNLYWIALVVAGVVACCFPERLARAPVVLMTPLLGALALASMWVPYKDQRQSIRFYTSEEFWETGPEDVAEIRQAADRFSTPKDLFVVNGFNPGLLMRPLRVGWADDPGAVANNGPQFYIDRNARFFMSFADSAPTPGNFAQLPVLARGLRWELRCLDPKGCPAR